MELWVPTYNWLFVEVRGLKCPLNEAPSMLRCFRVASRLVKYLRPSILSVGFWWRFLFCFVILQFLVMQKGPLWNPRCLAFEWWDPRRPNTCWGGTWTPKICLKHQTWGDMTGCLGRHRFNQIPSIWLDGSCMFNNSKCSDIHQHNTQV